MAVKACWFRRNAPNFNEKEAWGDLSVLMPRVPLFLQKIRNIYGAPIRVLNGASPRPNRPGSMHPCGLAVDFAPTVGDNQDLHICELIRLFCVTTSLNPPGLGLYPLGSNGFGFLHIDVREGDKARWTAYSDGGIYNYERGIDSCSVYIRLANILLCNGEAHA